MRCKNDGCVINISGAEMIAVGRLTKYEYMPNQGDWNPGWIHDPHHAAANRHRPVGNGLMCELEEVWR